jgi:hypothetical protein
LAASAIPQNPRFASAHVLLHLGANVDDGLPDEFKCLKKCGSFQPVQTKHNMGTHCLSVFRHKFAQVPYSPPLLCSNLERFLLFIGSGLLQPLLVLPFALLKNTKRLRQ